MATTYLSKTQVTGTSTRKMTISAWVKIADPSVAYAAGAIWSMGSDSSNFIELQFNDANRLELKAKNSGSYVLRKATAALFKDTSAWYHIVVGVDSDQVSGPDRNKIYINGVQYAGTWDTDTDATINTDFKMNSSSEDARCGRDFMSGAAAYFDGEMAHVHYIDGTQYAASDFGETDATSGIWVAKTDPSVTYGNNGGFYKFASGALGTDSSGKGNTMAVSGTMTANKDNPDNNFATLNPLTYVTGSPALTNCNTTVTGDGPTKFYFGSTLGMVSGKWYSEYKIHTTQASATIHLGISSSPTRNAYNNNFPGEDTRSYSWGEFGSTWYNNSGTAQGTSFTAGDIVGIALDADNSNLYFSKNGSWISIGGTTGDPTSGASGTGAISINSADSNGGNGFWHFAIGDNSGSYGGTNVINCNFGNGYFGTTAISSAGTVNTGDDSQFEYDVPTGYYGLNTKNLGSYS